MCQAGELMKSKRDLADEIEPLAAPPPAAFTPEQSLPHAFSVVANRVSLTLEQMYSQLFGLSVVGWRVIAMLGAHAPLSAKALAELTAMSQVNITRAVEQLVELKLVSRRVDAVDRRRVALRLSKDGKEVYNRVVPVLEACESALLAGIPDVDADALRRIMKVLVDRASLVLGENSDWQRVLETYARQPRPDKSDRHTRAPRVTAAEPGMNRRRPV